jgi:hypothetical protein
MTEVGDISQSLDIDARYMAARRVLLDALAALAPHGNAVILAGAQAIYLRTGTAELAIAPGARSRNDRRRVPSTTDGRTRRTRGVPHALPSATRTRSGVPPRSSCSGFSVMGSTPTTSVGAIDQSRTGCGLQAAFNGGAQPISPADAVAGCRCVCNRCFEGPAFACRPDAIALPAPHIDPRPRRAARGVPRS